MRQQVVIVGLGRLGVAMAETLVSLGHEVLAMDIDRDRIQYLADDLPDVHLVAADATDEDVLRGLDVGDFDQAAVVIGENVEASVLATANLIELGVPTVVARASSKLHARVLEKIGAHRVVEPEKEMGAQLARTMTAPIVMDYVNLGDDEALIESRVPAEWAGKSLAQLDLYRKSGVTILALKAKGTSGTIPRGDTVLNAGDVIVVGGPKDKLDDLGLFR
jgi:trk system potassium uptake protein TrkA